MQEISKLPKDAIAEKLLAEINLHEKDYYGKNSKKVVEEQIRSFEDFFYSH